MLAGFVSMRGADWQQSSWQSPTHPLESSVMRVTFRENGPADIVTISTTKNSLTARWMETVEPFAGNSENANREGVSYLTGLVSRNAIASFPPNEVAK